MKVEITPILKDVNIVPYIISVAENVGESCILLHKNVIDKLEKEQKKEKEKGFVYPTRQIFTFPSYQSNLFVETQNKEWYRISRMFKEDMWYQSILTTPKEIVFFKLEE